MWHGYASYAGTELWNNVRTLDYLYGDPDAGIAGLAPPYTSVNVKATCRNALDLFCEPPSNGTNYRTPALDGAPWYDPDVPESARFAGLFVETIDGFDSVLRREMTDLATVGGSIGPLRFSGRQLTVTGWLRAADCCAAEYGLRWLMEALIGGTCDGCALDDLYMLKCCPPDSDTSPSVLDYARLMQRVAVIDGPKVTDRAGSCCDNCTATSLRVQFTLASETPYLFSEVEYLTLAEGEEFDTMIVGRSWTDFCPDCPPPIENPLPSCAPTYLGPPPPFIVDDVNCYCEPWFTARKCLSFSNDADWNDVSTIIEVTAGQDPIKNLKVAAFHNPLGKQGKPCPCDWESTDDWKCQTPCAQFVVAEMPSGSVLTVDSRSRIVNLTLAGGKVVPGLRYLASGSKAVPFEWFDIGPCTNVCFVASIATSSATACEEPPITSVGDARISVGLVNRYLASGG